MIVSITCPSCKEKDAIEASINPNDLESSSVIYPDECPHCFAPITNDMIAQLQYQALIEIHDSMTESIFERSKEREIDKMIYATNRNKH